MHLPRRSFLQSLAAALFAAPAASAAQSANNGTVETVLGPAPIETLGPTLMHEHLLVDFIGANRVSRDRYNRDEVFTRMLPFLEQARAEGCRTIVECTPAWIGRDPVLLKHLSEASGIALLTNTGYYGAANDKFVPAHAYEERAEQLAGRWIREAREGIEGTGIKPAFMKIGVDPGQLSAIDEKLVRAAALTYKATGLVIGSHTGNGVAALAQLDVLRSLGVPASSFIWIHAQNEKDRAVHVAAAERGAWVEFDGLSEKSFDEHLQLVLHMRERGHLARTLVSHDAGWYHVGEPNGGEVRPFTLLFKRFLPALRKAGLTAAEKRQLIVDNPHRALTVEPTGASVRAQANPLSP
jgi:phosphotriesterase-related protein